MKESLERLELSNKPKLIISEKLQRQINYLHNKIGSVEWSGELITSEKGDITHLDKWEITAEELYLSDIGTPGYTGYEVGEGAWKPEDIIGLYDKYPGLLDGSLKRQHVHTHHNMQAFFSTTDWENLEDRAVECNYFLMLIVNFEGDYKAKVAFKGNITGKKESKITLVNNMDGYEDISLVDGKDKEVLVVLDCAIEYKEPVVNEEFINRYNHVKEEVETAKAKVKAPYYGSGSHYPGTNYYGGTQRTRSEEYHKPPTLFSEYNKKPVYKKEKKISDMTDAEWREYMKEFHRQPVADSSDLEISNFSDNDVKVFLNTILSDGKNYTDSKDPFNNIKKLVKRLATDEKMQEFLESSMYSLDVYYNILYPNRENEYYQMLIDTRELLESYNGKGNVQDFITEFIEELTIEIDEESTTNPAAVYSSAEEVGDWPGEL